MQESYTSQITLRPKELLGTAYVIYSSCFSRRRHVYGEKKRRKQSENGNFIGRLNQENNKVIGILSKKKKKKTDRAK